MVDEVDIESSQNEEAEDSIFDQPAGHDWLLAWVINQAELWGIELDVTLYVSGTIITGQVISGAKHFQLQADRTRAGSGNKEVLEAVANGFESLKTMYPPRKDGDFQKFKPKYIHLENAVTVLPGLAPANGLLWRGKVQSIDGVTIGRMTIV